MREERKKRKKEERKKERAASNRSPSRPHGQGDLSRAWKPLTPTIRKSIDRGSGTAKRGKSPDVVAEHQCAVEAPVVTERRVLRITKQYSSRNHGRRTATSWHGGTGIASGPCWACIAGHEKNNLRVRRYSTGEHEDWPGWSFQFTAYMGSAYPKSSEALRWAAIVVSWAQACGLGKPKHIRHYRASLVHWHPQ